jgi:hypothetical protein
LPTGNDHELPPSQGQALGRVGLVHRFRIMGVLLDRFVEIEQAIVRNRRLVVNEREAKTVHHIFRRVVDLGTSTLLVKELRLDGVTSKAWTTKDGRVRQGKPIEKASSTSGSTTAPTAASCATRRSGIRVSMSPSSTESFGRMCKPSLPPTADSGATLRAPAYRSCSRGSPSARTTGH